MAGNGYLRTVNFGGFDKKDVLAYVDELNTKIYNLETQLGEKNDALAAYEASSGAASENFEGKEALEKKLEESQKKVEESHAKVSELMASTDSLKLQLSNVENDSAEKDAQIEQLKNEIEELKQKVSDAEASAAAGGGAAFDMSGLFMEAQKSANAVDAQAKEAAKKMEQDAKELQDQILEDANNQAAKIVSDANEEAKTTTDNANAQAEAMIKNAKEQEGLILEKSQGIRNTARDEFTDIDINVQKIAGLLNELLNSSIEKTDNLKKLTAEGLALVNGGSNFKYVPKGSDVTNSSHKVNTGNDNKNNANSNKSEEQSLDELTRQALAAVQAAEQGEAPRAENKPKGSSFARSLKFTDPAPDSVKTSASANNEHNDSSKAAKAEEVKPEEPQAPETEKTETAQEEAPKTEEVKAQEPQEEKTTFHMAGNKPKQPVEEQTDKAEQAPKHNVSGLSMSKGGGSGLKMGGGPKSANPVNSRDQDMMAALARDIQNENETDDDLSDDDILKSWGGKKNS